MHAFTDPYLNVKLHTCLCQQLNYTIKNGACLWKYVVSLFRIHNKCKSAYNYRVTNKREELVFCKHIFYQALQHQDCYGLWSWRCLSARFLVVFQCFKELGPQWWNKCRRHKGQRSTVHWCTKLLKEVVSHPNLTNTHTHALMRTNKPECEEYQTHALHGSGYSNHEMSLERKNPTTSIIQGNLSLNFDMLKAEISKLIALTSQLCLLLTPTAQIWSLRRELSEWQAFSSGSFPKLDHLSELLPSILISRLKWKG